MWGARQQSERRCHWGQVAEPVSQYRKIETVLAATGRENGRVATARIFIPGPAIEIL
jgi:hypothetical protein